MRYLVSFFAVAKISRSESTVMKNRKVSGRNFRIYHLVEFGLLLI